MHTPHPKYFGLFNPRANFASIIADLITASYNPQLAAWSHAPFAVEIEKKIIKDLCVKFGYSSNNCDGVFTTGGAEANLTAILSALNNKYPNFAQNGVFGINKKPIIFCSIEAHHSIQKAAKIVGLGYDSVKSIPCELDLRLSLRLLEKAINEFDSDEFEPLMVIGTAGTTGTGSIDELFELSKLCKKHNIWFHVDAAFGGAGVLSNQLRLYLNGIQNSDSITFDIHKWMSVPMGTSVFLTCHNEILSKTFSITTDYMPKDADKIETVEPYSHSIQWSRRFNGLKLYLSLLVYGWDGYEETINYQTDMGDLLRKKLKQSGWIIQNDTVLPVVCFTDEKHIDNPNFVQTILDKILQNRIFWLSSYPINGNLTFRACITNYNTSEADIDAMVNELNHERNLYNKSVISTN